MSVPAAQLEAAREYDPARWRRGVRRGREKGCWVYIPRAELVAAGLDPDEPPPWYRTVGRPHSTNTGRVLVSLRRDAS